MYTYISILFLLFVPQGKVHSAFYINLHSKTMYQNQVLVLHRYD